jgi:membrane fusion protein (multidrug efflux system)
MAETKQDQGTGGQARPAGTPATAPAGASGGGPKLEPPKRPLPRWPWFIVGIVVLAFVAVVLVIIFKPHADVWADDANVTVRYASVAPRIAGQIASVDVDDNQEIKAGQVLATIDPRDYQTALDLAEATLERDRAQLADVVTNVARQPSLIDQQQAAVASAQARLDFARLDARRFDNLAISGAGTTQQRQQADADLRQGQAALQSAQAALEASRRQLAVLEAQQAGAQATVKANETQVVQAQLNLSYTKIAAPMDGMVGALSVQVGNYVAPGSTLMTLVPLDKVYIEANYREVDLLNVKPGQHVGIHVDAYNIDLDGVVDSVPPASGAAFAPISPSNATGNFTKIVQRLPVKIVVPPGQPLARLLRVGFSVETTIHTDFADIVGAQERAGARVTAH